MPRAILMFRLPQEQGEHKIAIHAMDWALTCFDLDNWLRERLKYHAHELSEGEDKAYEECRKKLWELMRDYGVSTDDIE